MMTQAQNRKLEKIKLDVEEMLDSDTNANEVLMQVVQFGAPILMGFMQGKTPDIRSLQSISTNLLAIVLASTKDDSAVPPTPPPVPAQVPVARSYENVHRTVEQRS